MGFLKTRIQFDCPVEMLLSSGEVAIANHADASGVRMYFSQGLVQRKCFIICFACFWPANVWWNHAPRGTKSEVAADTGEAQCISWIDGDGSFIKVTTLSEFLWRG